MIKAIILEDDILKAKDISDFIKTLDVCVNLDTADSYNSGIKLLKRNKYDLLILDMSMPTFTGDYITNETSFDKFAGVMVLKELKRLKISVPTILFTMFDDFGSSNYSISLKEMDEELGARFEHNYLGYVYFESGSINWQSDIKKIINDNYTNR